MKNKITKIIIALILPQLAGGIGSIFTTQSVGNWYQTLEKPFLNPPSWVFAPVWTTLFILMGVALFLIWKDETINRKLAFWIFGIQLVLNTLWSFLFFGLQNPGLAFFEIIILWIAILTNIIIFYRLNKTAGILLIPYILWVSFAAYLNFQLWKIN